MNAELQRIARRDKKFFLSDQWKEIEENYRMGARDFPGGPVAKTPYSLCRGPRFDSWLGNWIPHGGTESLHATMKIKDPACRK